MDILTLKKAQKYTDKKAQEIKLKISQIEKELDNYQQTMAMVNINQEPKQTATGYGTVTFPPNAANGQVSASVKGSTRTNKLLDSQAITSSLINFFSLGNAILSIDNTEFIYGSSSLKVETSGAEPTPGVRIPGIKVNAGESIIASVYVKAPIGANMHILLRIGGGGTVLETKDFTGTGDWQRISISQTIPTSETDINIFIRRTGLTGSDVTFYINGLLVETGTVVGNFITGTKSTIGACRLRSVSEDESEESTAYIIAKDENGNVVELKSLPNGVCDTIEDGKLIKRVGASILKADDILSISTSLVNVSIVVISKPVDYVGFGNNESPAPNHMNMTGELIKGYVYSDDVSSLGHVYTINNNFFGFIIEKGTTLAQAREKLAGMKITYQLAEPEIIPIEVSGTLLSNPSGTVHVENAVADAGLYTDKITVLQQDLPIRELEKIARVDFVTGQETELDITQAVISTDKLSFTHPDLADGDIVFFTYFYDREGTLGEVTLEYYDSRYTIKDTANEKFYQWKIISTNGTPSIALVEV